MDSHDGKSVEMPVGNNHESHNGRMEGVSVPAVTVDRLLGQPPTKQIGSLARRAAPWTCALLVVGYLVSMSATAVLAWRTDEPS